MILFLFSFALAPMTGSSRNQDKASLQQSKGGTISIKWCHDPAVCPHRALLAPHSMALCNQMAFCNEHEPEPLTRSAVHRPVPSMIAGL